MKRVAVISLLGVFLFTNYAYATITTEQVVQEIQQAQQLKLMQEEIADQFFELMINTIETQQLDDVIEFISTFIEFWWFLQIVNVVLMVGTIGLEIMTIGLALAAQLIPLILVWFFIIFVPIFGLVTFVGVILEDLGFDFPAEFYLILLLINVGFFTWLNF